MAGRPKKKKIEAIIVEIMNRPDAIRIENAVQYRYTLDRSFVEVWGIDRYFKWQTARVVGFEVIWKESDGEKEQEVEIDDEAIEQQPSEPAIHLSTVCSGALSIAGLEYKHKICAEKGYDCDCECHNDATVPE